VKNERRWGTRNASTWHYTKNVSARKSGKLGQTRFVLLWTKTRTEPHNATWKYYGGLITLLRICLTSFKIKPA